MAAVLAVAGVVLFAFYYGEAGTVVLSSDGASNLLQAQDMLHGNVLLRGWTLSDVSFYDTENPQYLLIELARGLGPAVVRIGAAMTYTLLVLAAALLARGRATGREGAVRALMAGGIMLAPSLGLGSGVFLSNPDHTGTQLPLIAAWLLIDRARPRWYVPAAIALIMAWTQIADAVVLQEGVLPLVAVCAVRLYRGTAGWYEPSLAAAALAGAGTGALVLRAIGRAGGFASFPLTETFATVSQLSSHVWLTAQSVLLLYGGDFSGMPLDAAASVVLVHLAGAGLAATAFCRGLRRFGEQDLVTQLLVVAMAALLVCYTVLGSPDIGGGPHDVAGALPAGAVLAGRLIAPRVTHPRQFAVLAAVLACYACFAVPGAVRPAAASPAGTVAAWLRTRQASEPGQFRYGLAVYWNAASMTADAGGQVLIRPVSQLGARILIRPWESDSSWYDPARADATFLVLRPPPASCPPATLGTWLAAAARTFGRPAVIYHVGRFEILTYRHNLLTQLTTVPPGRPQPC